MKEVPKGTRVKYSEEFFRSPNRRGVHPRDLEFARGYRGVVVSSSGAIANVQWDGSDTSHTYHVREPAREDEVKKEVVLPDSFDDLVLTRKGVLLTPDGEFPLVKIGQGAFTTVYESAAQRAVVAVTAEGAYDKEILAAAHAQNPNNPHIPAVVRYGTLMDNRQVFTMPKYNAPMRLGNLNSKDRKSYQEMRACLNAPPSFAMGERQRPYDIVRKQLECMEQAKIDPEILEAVSDIHNYSTNYGDTFRIEISPRNVATDESGNLVLLDLFFDQELLVRQRHSLNRQRGRRPGHPSPKLAFDTLFFSCRLLP